MRKEKLTDVARTVPASVKLKSDGDAYSFKVKLARDSALTVILEK